MRVTGDEVVVEVEFDHPTFLRILHHLTSDPRGDERHVDEWLKTLAWVQLQRETGRFEAPVIADLPEEVRTNIELYYQSMADDPDRDASIEDVINEFVDLEFGELIDMNDLEDG